MTDSAVNNIIVPTFNDVISGGRFDVISIGFILALWSGSRALNVFVDTITIMHGLGGHRGIVRTRALSFLLYVLGLLTGVVTIPLVVAGPTLVDRWLPDRVVFLEDLYWPTWSCSASASWRRSTTCPCRFGRPGATTCPVRRSQHVLLGGRLVRCCAGCSRSRPPTQLGLRPAGRADRGTAVALPGVHRRAHRRGPERRVRPVWPQDATAKARTELVRRLSGVLPVADHRSLRATRGRGHRGRLSRRAMLGPVGNVNLPTPVVLAGGGLCLLGGYLVGVVAGPEGPDRATGVVESYDSGTRKLCLRATPSRTSRVPRTACCAASGSRPPARSPPGRATPSGSSPRSRTVSRDRDDDRVLIFGEVDD